MDDCRGLYEETKIYGDFVKAFLVAVRNTDEAERSPMLVASAAAARERLETLQSELARVWSHYQALSRGR